MSIYRVLLACGLASFAACSVPDYFLIDGQGSGSGSGHVDAGADAMADAEPGAALVSSVSSSTPDGSYKAGATISIQVTFSTAVTVDTAGGTPTLALNTGSDATYLSGSGTTTLTFSYTVAAGEFSVNLDYDQTTALSLNGGTIKNGAINSSLVLPAPGATNSLGANRSIVIDAVPPTLSTISGPDAYAAMTTAALLWTLNESLPGSTTCTQSVGTGTMTSCNPTSAQFTGLSQGPHTITIKHTDAAGNVSAPQTYSWTVDTTTPTVSTVTGPAQYVSSTSASLSYSVTEANPGTTSCTQNLGSGTLSSCTTTGATFSSLSEGFHSVSIKHTDLAGNVSSVQTYTWTVDTTPPTLCIAVSGPPTYASSNTANLGCTASDANIGTMTCALTAGTGTIDTCDQFGAKLSGLNEGPHTVTFKHTDRAGNTSMTQTFSWTVDTIAPVVSSITGVTGGGWISTSDVTLSYTVTETNPNTTTCSHTAGTGTQSACTSTRNQYTALSPGLHTMTIKHTDLAGNVSVIQTITFSACYPVTYSTANSSPYQFVTPSDCGTNMDIWAWGGGGSGGNPNTFGGSGGGAGFAAGRHTIASSGTVYSVFVGGGGKYKTGGLNGGGDGGQGANERGGGGGGWSGVSLGGVFYVVAAGGGGGGGCVSDANGGGAGGPIGFDGTGQASMGGKGATQTGPGAGGANGGQSGVGMTGGAGAGPGQLCGAGGGGGGVFGGGGGGSLGPPPSYGTGGAGGGSSKVDPSLANPQIQGASGTAPGGRTVSQYVQGVGVGTPSGNFNNGGDGMVIIHVHP